ncbi:MAG: hypothetical protein COC12_02690 [Rhodobacteraceae bacterium]|nr:MAG: hypothetical protein COC12_02690 [Paracoccaceae bacterium]
MLASLSGGASAQGLFKKLKDGASDVGTAIGKGANSVGTAVEKGANAVGDSIDSTIDLASNEDTPAQTRAKLDAMVKETLTRFFAETPDALALFDASAGYAVFDTRKVSVFPVAAGFGRGVAVLKDGGARTYMNMGTGGVGLSIGIGGFASQVVILFENDRIFENFVTNGYEATAEAGSVMGEDKTDETVRFVDGRSTFVLSKKGWRVNASVTGARFWLASELN